MGFSRFIAKRYLFAKKSQQAINIISGISVVGITVCVSAMIIILSAINGLEGLIEKIYSSFDPDIEIVAAEGKTFDSKTISLDKIAKIKGVIAYSETVEEICIVKNDDQWVHAIMKGVDDEFIKMRITDSLVKEGEPILGNEDIPYVIIGDGISERLVLSVKEMLGNNSSIKIYAPVRTRKYKPTAKMFEEKNIAISAILNPVTPEFDYKYILMPKKTVQNLLEYGTHISSIEINIDKNADPIQIKKEIEKLLGNKFKIKTKLEQNELMYKVNQSEKWFAFLMLVFVLALAAFNIMASLTMLIIDKKSDIRILKSMGATSSSIRNIFFLEGFFINLLGGFIGIIIGVGITLLQFHFHFIGMEGTIIDYYPVILNPVDLIYVFVAVIIVGIISTWLPVRFLIKRFASGVGQE